MITEKNLFDKALKQWGMTSQLLMLVEETQELAHASLKLLRASTVDRETANRHFAEELADVEFMITELKYYHCNQELVDKFRQLKRLRLAGLLGLTGAVE